MVNIIGLGECMVSNVLEDSIKTYALASCVGLVVYNPRDKVLGMVHIVLPEKKDIEGSTKPEGFFADTAVPMLFGKVFGRYPDEKTPYKITLYGGCASKQRDDFFHVGGRNVAQIEQILNEQRIRYDKSNTGGCMSRTIEAFVKDGSVFLRTQKMVI